jgi:capsular exopolysaccharide synthesis family protein
LIGVCALLIALDSVDRRVKTVGQAEIALPARVIAAIPQPMGNVSYANLARATEMQPSSLHSEAFRFLGLHLLSPRGPKVRSLMVLSAKAEQGSTTTVTNLAITLAQAGKKVILVDANVRTSELHQVFEMPNQFGFTDLLRDPNPDNIDRALTRTNVSNLEIITSGPMTDNAWQLFRSENLIELSRRLHERADFVLYDTPSALIFTDALNLAPVVDAAFLCVRALEPLTGAEQRVVELLEQSNVTVLGSVLSDVPTAVVEGYHNYQHYYGAPAAVAIAGRADAAKPMLEMPRKDGGTKNGSS